MNPVKSEPIIGLGLVQAVLALVMAFGTDLSADQVGAIMAVAAIVLAIIGRLLVVPVARFKAREAEELAKLQASQSTLQPPPESAPMYPEDETE